MNFTAKKYQQLDEIFRDVCSEIENFDVNFIYDFEEKVLERIELREDGNLPTYPLVIMTGWSEVEETIATLTVQIDQLWIITDTNKADYSESRLERKYNPILIPLQNELEYRIKSNGNVIFQNKKNGLTFASRRREMLAGDGTEREFTSPVDAIVYEGLQLMLNKKCK